MQFNATGTAATTLSLNLSTVSFDRADHVTTDSDGVFGQGTWTPDFMGDRFHLTGGGRFTQDHKTGDLDVVNGALPSYVNAAGQTVTGVIGLNKSWSHFDPLVNLAYDVTSDVHVYAKWDTGYKAGGANSRSLTYRPFDPETVSMYEVGAKTEFWDHKARLNIAAYYGEMKDVQVDFNVIVPQQQPRDAGDHQRRHRRDPRCRRGLRGHPGARPDPVGRLRLHQGQPVSGLQPVHQRHERGLSALHAAQCG